jgi:hypothetical protein
MIYLCELYKSVQTRAFGETFFPVSQRVQINFIFNYNERTLCLSFNIKRSKTTANLSENSWNKRSSNRFQWCHVWRQRLNRFIISLYTNKVP